MDLYEYQGKELLSKHGVETLEGIVAETPEEARQAAESFGGSRPRSSPAGGVRPAA